MGVVAACGWSVYAMFVRDPAEHGGSVWQLLIHASGGGIYLETAATVTTFLLAGRLYEARARRITGEAMRSLVAASARDVCLLGPGGSERQVPVSQLRPGTGSSSAPARPSQRTARSSSARPRSTAR